jgi:dipeptidyl aminopeptidase/acylaminoacyl peptidase
MAVTALVLLLGAGATEAAASNLVFVCGSDLCAADGSGKGRVRLTKDGRAQGGYTRPSVSRDGRRIAFKLDDPGRVWTAAVRRRRGRIVGLGRRTRIEAFRDGPRDATQFDVALSPDGRRVAWVEIRANVVSGGFDFRRYSARVDGSDARQVASNGGRPFVAWLDARSIIREGLGPGFDGEDVDQGLCVPAPQSETNGTCIEGSRQLAFDPGARHLRHPSVARGGRVLAATAYAYPSEDIDSAIERPGAIALFDTATAAPVRDLTTGPGDLYPSFDPTGRSVAFERSGAVWVVPARGGKARRLIRRARQPSWSR